MEGEFHLLGVLRRGKAFLRVPLEWWGVIPNRLWDTQSTDFTPVIVVPEVLK